MAVHERSGVERLGSSRGRRGTRRESVGIWIAVAAVLLISILYSAFSSWNFSLLSSDTARVVCEAIFIAHRDEALVREQELHQPAGRGLHRRYVDIIIDRGDKSVTGRLWGFFPRKALFRRGI